MSRDELAETVRFELEAMRIIVHELHAILADVRQGEPTIRDITAAGAFLAQFYTGVENILKRIHLYVAGPVPAGETWHVELFKRFCEPPQAPLPMLINPALEAELKPYRRFRHLVHHGYGFQLKWERMQEGVDRAQPVFERFEQSVKDFLERLEHS